MTTTQYVVEKWVDMRFMSWVVANRSGDDQNMEWTTEAVERLKQLWAEGVTAREIGEQLGGVSRNAVIGKAHRLGLSSKTKKQSAEQPQRTTGMDLTERMCRWPIGHPGDADFRFCGATRIANRPYCAQHCNVAYRGKADEAA